MSQRLSRFLAIAVLIVSAGGMLAAPFDAEARRMGGGKSFGTQSSNITSNRSAATPPAANTTRNATAPNRSGATAGAAANANRSGMSRFLGPIAGIAAGLGIAALLSHLGLGGAFLEFLSSAILIALVVFAIMFLVRRFRGGQQPAMAQGEIRSSVMPIQAPAGRSSVVPQTRRMRAPSAASSASVASATSAGAAAAPVPAAPVDTSWYIPEGFDTANFLANAKQQFIKIQALWDAGDIEQLREYMTDDLVAELKPELLAESQGNHTEVVLLNAELLGVEQVSGGHLASVRYSGMLRETARVKLSALKKSGIFIRVKALVGCWQASSRSLSVRKLIARRAAGRWPSACP